jgi:hypothetical protein
MFPRNDVVVPLAQHHVLKTRVLHDDEVIANAPGRSVQPCGVEVMLMPGKVLLVKFDVQPLRSEEPAFSRDPPADQAQRPLRLGRRQFQAGRIR